MISQNLRKEFRAAFLPWAMSCLGLLVWYWLGSVELNALTERTAVAPHGTLVGLMFLLSVPVLLHLIAAPLFAGEFVWGTISQLLSAPIPRSRLWRDKCLVLAFYLGTAFLIPLVGHWRGLELYAFLQTVGGIRTFWLLVPVFLTALCIVPWFALHLRAYLSSVLAGVLTAPSLVLCVVFLALMWEEFLARSYGVQVDHHGFDRFAIQVYWVLLLACCGAAFLRTRRLFTCLELGAKASRRGSAKPGPAPQVARRTTPTHRIPVPRRLIPFWKEWRQLSRLGGTALLAIAVWSVAQLLAMYSVNTTNRFLLVVLLGFLATLFVGLSGLAIWSFTSEDEEMTLGFLLAQPASRRHLYFRKIAAAGVWMALLCGVSWAVGRGMVLLLNETQVFPAARRYLGLTSGTVDEIAGLLGSFALFLLCTGPLLAMFVRGRAAVFLVPFLPILVLTVWFLAEDKYRISEALPAMFKVSGDMNLLPFIVMMAGSLFLGLWRFLRLGVR